MGLTIHYELSLPAGTPESEVYARLAKLRDEALALPIESVSELVRFTEHDIDTPSPMFGFGFVRLEDVVDVMTRFVRDDLHRESLGLELEETTSDDYFRVEAPEGLPVVALGFAIMPGDGSESASFGLAKLGDSSAGGRWKWGSFCKTQYASTHGNEHFLKCHTSVIRMLDAAKDLGIEIDVTDEGEFYESRDEARLLAHVNTMNHLIAQFAGALSDALAGPGGDNERVKAEIFQHPEFERIEMRE